MGKKLENNGMWESSRMMLPEHKEAILRDNKAVFKQHKPSLHEEELEIISRVIQESYMREQTITLVLFDEYENIHRTGIVTKIDRHKRTVKLQDEDDYDWIMLDVIVKAVSSEN